MVKEGSYTEGQQLIIVSGKILLVLCAAEIALGGNGYLFQIAGVRLREIFLLVCIMWTVTALLTLRLRNSMLGLTLVFLLITAFSAALGYASGSDFVAIVAEVKPLSYFLMLPFFATAIRTQSDIKLAFWSIAIGGVAVAALYLLTLVAPRLDLVSYSTVYEFLRRSDEFIFRHNPTINGGAFAGYFYKGAFYVGVATVFLAFIKGRLRWLAVFTSIAVGLTLTRSIELALAISLLFGGFRVRAYLPGTASTALCLLALFLSLYWGLATEQNLFAPKDPLRGSAAVLLSVKLGDLDLETQPKLNFKPGDKVRISNTGVEPPSKVMIGVVQSYNDRTGQIIVAVQEIKGNSLPDNLWIIELLKGQTATQSLEETNTSRTDEAPTNSTIETNPINVAQGQVKSDSKNYVRMTVQEPRGSDVRTDTPKGSDENTPDQTWGQAIYKQVPILEEVRLWWIDLFGASRTGEAKRLKDIGTVLGDMTPRSFLIGHGLGAKIGERTRIEVNYLEILHKQGILGLAPWIFILLYQAALYQRACRHDPHIATSLFCGTLFTYIATAGNTFLTGSIGMATVLISLASLKSMSEYASLRQ